MSEPTNADRADRAKQALLLHQEMLNSGDVEEELREDPVAVVADILTDLRHFCDSRDMSFHEADRLAYGSYSIEKVQERERKGLEPNA